MNYTVRNVVDVLTAKLVGRKDISFKYVTIDSRKILLAELSMFVAINGVRNDGHKYVDILYKKGVRCFLVEYSRIDYSNYKDASFIIVKDSLSAFQELMTYHRSIFTYPIISITGSNGKTIVKEWLYQILADDKKVIRSPRSYNSQVGVPLSLSLLSDSDNLAIIEAGISQKGEMTKLERMIKPNIGIFTNLGSAHAENFNSDLEKLREKLILFKGVERLIYYKNDSIVDNEIKSLFAKEKLFSWSDGVDADIIVKVIENNKDYNKIRVYYKEDKFDIKIPFGDRASFQNCMNCVACLIYLGYDFGYISSHVRELVPVAMRLEIKEGINDCIIVNDYYNSDPSSLNIAIDVMISHAKGKSCTIIISDLLQTGYLSERLYCDLATLLKLKSIRRFIGIGKDISKFQHLFEQESKFYNSTSDFVNGFLREDFKDEVILLRGARKFRFEEISILLTKKTHRTVLEVNTSAIVNNLNSYRALLKPETLITVMVKAFSYGNGLVGIAKVLEYNRVDYLAVAIADEGVVLRNAGIKVPIIVMNPEEYSFNLMIEYSLEPEIYSIVQLNAFGKALKRTAETHYPVHIKLDTGMNRMGFVCDDFHLLKNEIVDSSLFFVRSIFSHLVGSDDDKLDEFSLGQINKFNKWSLIISSWFDYKIIRHILNSSGIDRFSQFQYDMVRLGIGLYGLSSTNNKLENVSTLKTTISQIKIIKKGSTVGYGRKGKLNVDSKIAVIPIGYADGFNRKLGNRLGKVLINGEFAEVVGNVCMDMCMIDITGMKVKEGDEVIIFGDDYTAVELAKQLDTIPYEIITSISERVKRVYVSE